MGKHMIDEKTGISYTLVGDYYLPDLALSVEDEQYIGTFGRKRLKYIKEYRKGFYSSLALQGKLFSHLAALDEQAFELREQLIKQMAKAQGITEEMKNDDPLMWVGRMNNIKACADEIVLQEIVYI